MALLTADSLEVCYGSISALQGVSLEVEEGEIVAFIGSNGAGKTTLLKAISGLIRPRRGEVTWGGGRRITGWPAHEIVRLGMSHVPEGRQIFANLSVRDNLMLGAYQRRDRAGIAADLQHAYDLFPILASRQDQKSGTLSGGEQQMLAIGRALMARPKLLLLDEPSLGLAPLIIKKIFDIIRSINRDGTTIFLVEQNANQALAVAHRAYVLQTGRVIKADQASRLLADPEVKRAYLGG